MIETEMTEGGEQILMDGVKPITLGERLTAMTDHPMRPKRNPNTEQRPLDIGLFDEVGRAQMDLCDLIAELERGDTD